MSALLDKVRETLRQRNYSYRTEESYLYWIRKYIFFHSIRHPQEMGEGEIVTFLTHLAVQKRIAPSTQNQALSALLFLYRAVLQVKMPWIEGFTLAKRERRVPVVLTKD